VVTNDCVCAMIACGHSLIAWSFLHPFPPLPHPNPTPAFLPPPLPSPTSVGFALFKSSTPISALNRGGGGFVLALASHLALCAHHRTLLAQSFPPPPPWCVCVCVCVCLASTSVHHCLRWCVHTCVQAAVGAPPPPPRPGSATTSAVGVEFLSPSAYCCLDGILSSR
jgi:hypothetical protein